MFPWPAHAFLLKVRLQRYTWKAWLFQDSLLCCLFTWNSSATILTCWQSCHSFWSSKSHCKLPSGVQLFILLLYSNISLLRAPHRGVTWVFTNPVINFTSSFWFIHAPADNTQDARHNEFEGWMLLRASSTASQVRVSWKQQTWDIQVSLAGGSFCQLFHNFSSWYRNLVQAQLALKSSSKQILTFAQGAGYTCTGGSAGQEGTYLVLPEVTDFRPSPAWNSSFQGWSSVVHSLLCRAQALSFAESLWRPYWSPHCSPSWSAVCSPPPETLIPGDTVLRQSTTLTGQVFNTSTPKTGSRQTCSCNLDCCILLLKFHLGQGFQYARELFQHFWGQCSVPTTTIAQSHSSPTGPEHGISFHCLLGYHLNWYWCHHWI